MKKVIHRQAYAGKELCSTLYRAQKFWLGFSEGLRFDNKRPHMIEMDISFSRLIGHQVSEKPRRACPEELSNFGRSNSLTMGEVHRQYHETKYHRAPEKA